MPRCGRRMMSEMPVLAAGYERAYLFAAKLVPLQTQPRFSLPDDLGIYQGRAMGAIQGYDQLHAGQSWGLQRSLDKGSTEAHVGHPAESDNTSLCPQLDARIYTFALSPTMFHE
jgi:hypothetical protein